MPLFPPSGPLVLQGGNRNLLHNAAMEICQRGSVTTTANGWLIDRWLMSNSGGVGVLTMSQDFSGGPPGFMNALKVAITTADLGSTTRLYSVSQNIEGYNLQALQWGSSNGQTATLSFWAKSSLTGNFGGSIVLGLTGGASYPFQFSLPVANTWTYVTIVIPPTAIAAFSTPFDSQGQLGVLFTLGCSANYQGAANTWTSAGPFYSPPGCVNVTANANATFYISAVQLEVGTYATPFERRPYSQELLLCKRYLHVIGPYTAANRTFSSGYGVASGAAIADVVVQFPEPMRAVPTLVTTAPATFSVSDRVANYNLTAIALYPSSATTQNADIQCTTAGMTLGRAVVLYSASATLSQLTFSAEI